MRLRLPARVAGLGCEELPDEKDKSGAEGFATSTEEGGDVVGDVHVAQLHVVAETEHLVVLRELALLHEDGPGCDVPLSGTLISEIGVPPLDAKGGAQSGGEWREPATEQEQGETEQGPRIHLLEVGPHDYLVDGLVVCHEPVRVTVDYLMGDIITEKHAPLEHVGRSVFAFHRILLDARSSHLGEFSNGGLGAGL